MTGQGHRLDRDRTRCGQARGHHPLGAETFIPRGAQPAGHRRSVRLRGRDTRAGWRPPGRMAGPLHAVRPAGEPNCRPSRNPATSDRPSAPTSVRHRGKSVRSSLMPWVLVGVVHPGAGGIPRPRHFPRADCRGGGIFPGIRRPALEGYPLDNRGNTTDRTAAHVGTRTLFERAGFTKAADTGSALGAFPRMLMRMDLR